MAAENGIPNHYQVPGIPSFACTTCSAPIARVSDMQTHSKVTVGQRVYKFGYFETINGYNVRYGNQHWLDPSCTTCKVYCQGCDAYLGFHFRSMETAPTDMPREYCLLILEIQ